MMGVNTVYANQTATLTMIAAAIDERRSVMNRETLTKERVMANRRSRGYNNAMSKTLRARMRSPRNHWTLGYMFALQRCS